MDSDLVMMCYLGVLVVVLFGFVTWIDSIFDKMGWS